MSLQEISRPVVGKGEASVLHAGDSEAGIQKSAREPYRCTRPGGWGEFRRSRGVLRKSKPRHGAGLRC